MVCPYAGQQRGTIIHCSLVGRRVSSLRYPCKGNYRVCPLYRARAPEQQPRMERRQVEAPPPVAAAPSPPSPESPPVEKPVAAGSESQTGGLPEGVKPVGEALRDAFVEAQLILRSEALGRIRARFEELPRLLRGRVGEGPAFVSGTTGGSRFRCLYAQGVIFSIVVESGGAVVTGAKAVEELSGREVDARIYRFVLDKLSDVVAEAIKRDMMEALGG